MNIKRAQQLQIIGPNGKMYYGGDQDWYSSNTRAQGGCSSVAAANSLRALARNNPDIRKTIAGMDNMPRQIKEALCVDKPGKDCFGMLMTGIYNKMRAFEIPILRRIYDGKRRGLKFFKWVRPNQGQTNSGFIIGIIRFARTFGIDLKVNYLNTAFADAGKARDFIEKGLEKSGAVVMMTSYNKHGIRIHPGNSDLGNTLENGQDSSIKCHFVTITDMDRDRLLITTWGRPAVVDYNELTRSWRSIKAFESTLLYIEPSNRKEANSCMLNAYKAFLGGIMQCIKHLLRI